MHLPTEKRKKLQPQLQIRQVKNQTKYNYKTFQNFEFVFWLHGKLELTPDAPSQTHVP